MSWGLVTGVCLHTFASREQFSSYFSQKPALGVIGAALLITVVSLLPVFGEDEEGGHPVKKAATALESTPLETVAIVATTTPDVLVSMLQRIGIRMDSPSSNIEEITRKIGRDKKEIMCVVFENYNPAGKGAGDRD